MRHLFPVILTTWQTLRIFTRPWIKFSLWLTSTLVRRSHMEQYSASGLHCSGPIVFLEQVLFCDRVLHYSVVCYFFQCYFIYLYRLCRHFVLKRLFFLSVFAKQTVALVFFSVSYILQKKGLLHWGLRVIGFNYKPIKIPPW